MIPTIEQIVTDLLAGSCTQEQAVAWLEQHVTSAIESMASGDRRETLAAMAMQGLLSNLAAIRIQGFKDSEISEFAVMQADALIALLDR